MRRLLIFVALLMYCAFATAASCNASVTEQFAKFFARFSDDKQFAVNRSIFPIRVLKWEYGVDGNEKDDSAPVLTYASKAQYKSTPSLSAYMIEHELQAKVKSATSRFSVVEVFKQDSSWIETWHFVRRGKCWYFYEHQDHSL